jgi:hypothetical protein
LNGKVAAPVLKTDINGRDTLYPQKLALTSSTSGGRSVGIVCVWTKKPRNLFMVVLSVFLLVPYSFFAPSVGSFILSTFLSLPYIWTFVRTRSCHPFCHCISLFNLLGLHIC